MKKVIVIPARLDSSRLPKKVLLDLKGKTVIQRVYEQCLKVSNIDAVSSSHPFANKVFFAKSKISSNVKEIVLIILIYIFCINQKILNYICYISFQSHQQNLINILRV